MSKIIKLIFGKKKILKDAQIQQESISDLLALFLFRTSRFSAVSTVLPHFSTNFVKLPTAVIKHRKQFNGKDSLRNKKKRMSRINARLK
jgi:hypothetical protein